MNTLIGICCSALAGVSLPAAAVEKIQAYIDGMQTPAWVERHGERQVLQPGFVLDNRDRLLTGENARLRIQLGDGGSLSLAPDSFLEINALGVRDPHEFTAAFDLKFGALRYNAASAGVGKMPHAVNLRIGSITASSRGNDLLWARVGKDTDRLCLLDGSISVLHPSSEWQQLDQPLTCYVTTRSAAEQPPETTIETISSEQFAALAAQTDMLVEKSLGGPVLTQGVSSAQEQVRESLLPRRQRVYRQPEPRANLTTAVTTVDSEAEALAVYDRIHAAGYRARIKPFAAPSGYRYRIYASHLARQSDAAALFATSTSDQ
ncbi:MAG TPA: hypothetical protein PLF25_10030 [Accumulibacter sp.]|nr:hypothetical protein [Accumulibacter sp.]